MSTSDIAMKKPDGSRDRDNEFSVGNVYSLPADTPVDLLYSRQEHYDQHATTLEDVNAYYPVSRLQELVDRGRIGAACASASRCLYRLLETQDRRSRRS